MNFAKHEINKFLPALFLIFIALFVFLSFAYKGLQNTPDSYSYINAAENLSNGKGLAVNTTDFNSGKEYELYASWPPLFPVLLSIPMKVGADRITSVIIIQSISFLLLLSAVFILIYLSQDLFSAYIGLVAFSSMGSLYYVSGKTWSELTFTALAVTATIMLFLYYRHKESRFIYWAGVIAGLAALTRMNGAPLSLVGLILIFLSRRNHWKLMAKESIAYVLLSFGPLALWILRNLYYTGFITGKPRTSSTSTLFDVISFRLDIIFSDFFLPFKTMPYVNASTAATVALLISLITLPALLLFRHRLKSFVLENLPVVLNLVFLFLFMVASLLILSLPTNDSRYTFLLYPFLIVLVSSKTIREKSRVLFLLAMALFILGQASYSYQYIKQKQKAKLTEAPAPWYAQVRKIPISATIFSNDPRPIAFRLDRPVKRIPMKDPKEIRPFLKSLHKKGDYIVLFPKVRPYLAYDELLPGNNKGLVVPVLVNEKFVILRFLR